MKQIAAAFVKAKREFSPALKTSTNPHFRSKYADLGACLEAVNEALLNNGIAVYQETSEDASGVTVETVFIHESGESLRSGKLHVPAAKHDPQGFGSALTSAAATASWRRAESHLKTTTAMQQAKPRKSPQSPP